MFAMYFAREAFAVSSFAARSAMTAASCDRSARITLSSRALTSAGKPFGQAMGASVRIFACSARKAEELRLIASARALTSFDSTIVRAAVAAVGSSWSTSAPLSTCEPLCTGMVLTCPLSSDCTTWLPPRVSSSPGAIAKRRRWPKMAQSTKAVMKRQIAMPNRRRQREGGV
jgi:hypothetical protein